MIHYCYHPSPLGSLLLVSNDQRLWRVHLQNHQPVNPQPDWCHSERPLLAARRQLDEYFGGERRQFELPLVMAGTPFQRQVWQALQQIPLGETRSYQQLATTIGRPRAVRAVGAANGANLLAIVVPCHRVIGSNGQLTGYAGGLANKAALLAMEQQWRGAEG